MPRSLFFFAIFSLPWVAHARQIDQDVVRVLVIHQDLDPFNQVLAGMLEANRDRSEIIRLKMTTETEVREKIKDLGNLDAVIGIGSASSRKARLLFPTLPVYFSLVLEPSSLEQEVGPFTGGVRAELDPADCARSLKAMHPGIGNVGLLYSRGSQKYAQEFKAAGALQGFQVVAGELDRTQDLIPALQRLFSSRIEMLFILPDPKIYNAQSIGYVLLETFKRNLPCVGPSQSFVKAGCAWGFSYDLAAIGAQTLEMVLGEQQAIQAPSRVHVLVNQMVSRKMNLSYPSGLTVIYLE